MLRFAGTQSAGYLGRTAARDAETRTDSTSFAVKVKSQEPEDRGGEARNGQEHRDTALPRRDPAIGSGLPPSVLPASTGPTSCSSSMGCGEG